MWGIAKAVKKFEAIDIDFIRAHCRNTDQWLSTVDAVGWEEIETKSGVPRSEIESIAEVYAGSKKSVFSWTMGITHHAHGVQNVQAIASLAL